MTSSVRPAGQPLPEREGLPNRQPVSLASRVLHEVTLLFARNLTPCFRRLCFPLARLSFQTHSHLGWRRPRHTSPLPNFQDYAPVMRWFPLHPEVCMSENKIIATQLPEDHPTTFLALGGGGSTFFVWWWWCFTFSILFNSLKDSSAHHKKYLGHSLLQ